MENRGQKVTMFLKYQYTLIAAGEERTLRGKQLVKTGSCRHCSLSTTGLCLAEQTAYGVGGEPNPTQLSEPLHQTGAILRNTMPVTFPGTAGKSSEIHNPNFHNLGAYSEWDPLPLFSDLASPLRVSSHHNTSLLFYSI